MVEQQRQRVEGVRGIARRVVVLLVFAVAGVATGRVVTSVLEDPTPTAFPASAPTARPSLTAPSSSPAATRGGLSASQDGSLAHGPLRRAAAVLRSWDAERSAAYARGDPAALRLLYLPDSRAAVRDVRTLEAYAARGLVVRGLRTQVLALQVLSRGRGRLTLEVTDRLVGGRAVASSSRDEALGNAGLALPRDGPTRRVLLLRHHAGEWRMGSVQPA